MSKRYSLYLAASLMGCLFLQAGSANAGGYAILEQSAEGVGLGFAGAVTGYGDGSSAFFNPAAMSALDGSQATFGGHVIVPSAEFQNRGSTVAGFPNIGDNGPDGGEAVFVPNFYAIHEVDDKLTLGGAINAPFGLATEYDRDWVGRYQGVKSELTVVNAAASAAYDVTDNFSVGGSFGALYGSAELTNAIDFGTIGFSALGPATASALGLAPQSNDGFVSLEGEDWSTSWSLGALVRYGDENRNRIGVSYRGKSTLNLHGKQAEFEVPTAAAVLTTSGAFTTTGASAQATLPESVSAGVSHWVNDQWGLLWESQWTRWSRFQELRILFDNPAQADSVTEQNWNNVWRHSIGVRFRPNETWEARGGFTYDEEPIPDDEHRTPRIPGNDRKWLAGGLTYHFNPSLSLDFSYAHLFVSDSRSNTPSSTGGVLVGEWDSAVDIVSTSFVWDMG